MNLILPVFMLFLVHSGCCWDSEEMELFDVVEEVNQNFYDVMGITQDADLSEIKKAYRTLSRQIHPDKSDAPDAEVKFRQLVSVYEILKDDSKRVRYNRVLVEGLPDWRSPIYYYRRARKMSLLEISVILTVVISITQYLMAWGSYLDKKHTMGENLMKKYKIKDRKKKKTEDLENIALMEEELESIPRPSWWNILPLQLVRFVVFLVTGGPGLVKLAFKAIEEEKQKRTEENLKKEEEEKKLKEEEERRKEKKAQQKARKRVVSLPDYTNEECVLDSVGDPDESVQVMRPIQPSVPTITGGPWTDEEFSELARLMVKFPGGTTNRWERIGEQMNRTVFEVTKMSAKVKAELGSRQLEQESDSHEPQVKVKQKTKGGKHLDKDTVDLSLGFDEMWSVLQQRTLEKALKQFPKGTDQRWERIAKCVPDKSKEECMMRFKFLVEKIKKKKEEEKEECDETGEEHEPQEEERNSVISKSVEKGEFSEQTSPNLEGCNVDL